MDQGSHGTSQDLLQFLELQRFKKTTWNSGADGSNPRNGLVSTIRKARYRWLVARGLVPAAVRKAARISSGIERTTFIKSSSCSREASKASYHARRWPLAPSQPLGQGVLGGVATLLGGVWWLHRFTSSVAPSRIPTTSFGDLVHQGKTGSYPSKTGTALMAQNGQINDELVLLPAADSAFD